MNICLTNEVIIMNTVPRWQQHSITITNEYCNVSYMATQQIQQGIVFYVQLAELLLKQPNI